MARLLVKSAHWGMARRGVVLAFAVGLLALAGCAPAAPTLLTSGETFAIVDSPQQVSGDAGFVGQLAIGDNGCWGVSGGELEFQNIVWPSGTALDGDDRITLPRLRSLGVGAKITGGGGGGPAVQDEAPCWSKGDDVFYLSEIVEDAG
jgi:hypothetical protein